MSPKEYISHSAAAILQALANGYRDLASALGPRVYLPHTQETSGLMHLVVLPDGRWSRCRPCLDAHHLRFALRS